MTKPQFVYVTYIATTPELLFNALIDGKLTREYWGADNVSDWKPGSPWEHRDAESGKQRIVGEVLEFDPPRRLVTSWASPADAGNPAKHSRVSYELEPMEGQVKLTVTHSELEPDSDMLKGITRGWPIVLSSLKSLLETGKPLARWW
jgi:uncharacterized protein YndB with AHSA1/START domain